MDERPSCYFGFAVRSSVSPPKGCWKAPCALGNCKGRRVSLFRSKDSIQKHLSPDKIGRLGLKTFVESSLQGRALYESCGFVVTENVDFDGGKVREEWASYGKIPFLWMERKAKDISS